MQEIESLRPKDSVTKNVDGKKIELISLASVEAKVNVQIKDRPQSKSTGPWFREPVTPSDIGVVAYFEKDCPQGWEAYDAAQDRFMIGASQSRPVLAQGGEETHTLLESKIPAHQHFIFGVRNPAPAYV